VISILIAAALLVQSVPPAASTRVAGRVVNSINADMVANAVVILRAHDPEHSLSYADTTDAKGHFSIGDVAPGEYGIDVKRAGFMLEPTGAAGAPGPNVKVNAGQQIDGLDIPVAPLGVITGRIVDSDGEASRGAKVEALHYIYTGGKKQLRSVAQMEAGDHGDFRLFGLRAGTYYLRATGLQTGSYNLPDKGTATYYPGSADALRAVPVELHAGAQIHGFDIRLQLSGAHSVRFEHAPGDAAWWTGGSLFNSQGFVPTEGWSSGSEVGFGNVPPGSYVAIFTGGQGDEKPSYAVRHLEVADADVDGGEIVLAPGAEITGMVRVETGAVGNLGKLHIKLTSDYRDFTQFEKSADVNSDASFAVKGVAPLTYELSIDRTAGVYLKSVRMGDRILAEPRIDASEKLEPLTVVLGADTGELEGAVVNSKGDPLARARVDAIARDRADFNRFAFSDEKGQYKFPDLPPGQYKILAWENVPDGAPQDPEFRKAFDQQSVSVTIQPNGRADLKISAISAVQVDHSLQ
jgi:carboxypeptidase family protein